MAKQAKVGGAREGAGRPRDVKGAQAALDAALSLLEERGWEGVSIDDVAKKSGVAKSTIYRHFPSKAELMVAATHTLFIDPAEVELHGRLREQLIQLVSYARSSMIGRPGRVLRILLREAGLHVVVNRLLQRAIGKRRQHFVAVLDAAVKKGELRAVNRELMVDLLLGPLWIRAAVTGAAIPAELPAQVVDAALAGLVKSS